MDLAPVRDVMRRSAENPLIALDDMPFACSDIWNAALIRHEDKILMLMTIETLEGRYQIHKATSDDGVHFTVDVAPVMAPLRSGKNSVHEAGGVRDPRITPVDGLYYITYVADGNHGLRIGLAKTRDFSFFERMGYISQVDVKNGVLFPRKIGDRYAIFRRPDAGMSIWVSYSEDMTFWGDAEVVMAPRGGYWDATRIGAAAPPLEIDEGWLLIYYGEKATSAGPLVRLGAAILDRENPATVLARSNIPILSPREKYERIGDVPNVVFSCGAMIEGEDLVVVYGASDSCVCRAQSPLSEVVKTCYESEGVY